MRDRHRALRFFNGDASGAGSTAASGGRFGSCVATGDFPSSNPKGFDTESGVFMLVAARGLGQKLMRM